MTIISHITKHLLVNNLDLSVNNCDLLLLCVIK